MPEKSDSINHRMTGEELRESWQGRALAWTAKTSPKAFRVLCSVLCDNYEETMPWLLAAVFDGFWGLYAPYFTSSAKINKAGQIVADLIAKDGEEQKGYVVFDDEDQMQGQFRKLADLLKFTDAERIDLFIAVRHWVKADQRLDPTFDRRDPDAKRLVLH